MPVTLGFDPMHCGVLPMRPDKTTPHTFAQKDKYRKLIFFRTFFLLN